MELEKNSVIHGDCLKVMKDIPDKSIDMINCDLPYGTTACKWDTIIPFEPLWKQYKRIIKDNGAIVLSGTEPFSSYLRLSNSAWYKYDWIWNKKRPANWALSKYVPLKITENILIFCKSSTNNAGSKNTAEIMMYNPQGIQSCNRRVVSTIKNSIGKESKNFTKHDRILKTTNYPKNLIYFKQDNCKTHPTQKPVALYEYLIKTYTNEGDTVLDNCAGSGTTAVACINLNRNYILIEQEQKYVDICNQRISEATRQMRIF